MDVYYILECMVRMTVDAAYADAFRTDNCYVLLEKGTQIFYLLRYKGREVSDLYKAVIMMSESIIDILLIAS